MLIRVYSDVVCPWCYVGERRLEKALRRRPDARAEVAWRPFQLQPGMPAGGVPWEEFAPRKFGGWENARGAFAHLAGVGRAEGIDFRFERVLSAPNTVDAHRLILYAAEEGLQWPVADALFRAYFTEGGDIEDHETLAGLASDAGLDGRDVEAYLKTDRGADVVWKSQKEAYASGVSGVPHYVFDGRFPLSGAQPVETFIRALDAARDGGG